jgi:hypothetical protein
MSAAVEHDFIDFTSMQLDENGTQKIFEGKSNARDVTCPTTRYVLVGYIKGTGKLMQGC